jgi:hypothetical protein
MIKPTNLNLGLNAHKIKGYKNICITEINSKLLIENTIAVGLNKKNNIKEKT